MSALFGFVVGYVVGARAGSEGYARLEQAWRDVRNSREFQDFVELVRSHVLGTLQTVNERMQERGRVLPDVDDLTAQARARLDLD